MAKKITKLVKLQLNAGKANPAPPVGTALGPTGVNIQEFCVKFNDATKEKGNTIIPVEISIYEDRTFTFILKEPPASELIRKKAGVDKGSGEPNKKKVATLTWAQCLEIASQKIPDMNAYEKEKAAYSIAGTARSMGVTIEGIPEAA